MNNDRRKALAGVRGEIEELQERVSSIVTQLEELKDEEQEYFDNMPESLQGGEKGDMAAEAVSNLENAISDLEGHGLS